jgi:hypothetical protein
VIGTVAGTLVMTVAQGAILRRRLGGIEGAALLASTARIFVAGALLGAVSYGAWLGLDDALGRSLAAQAIAVGAASGAGLVVYAGAVWALGVPEARQIRALLPGRG